MVDALYEAKNVGIEFIEDLLPDQASVIGPRSWNGGKLHRENPEEPIPEQLKAITEKIGRSIRNELMAKDFTGFKIAQEYVNDIMRAEDICATLLKNEEYKLPDRIEDWKDQVISGWLELFRWCVIHNKLVNGFKVITKDNRSQEIGDLQRHKFLIPFRHMGFNDIFEDIFPESRILHEKYFALDPQESVNLIESLRNYKVFVVSLPIYEQEANLDYGKLRSISAESHEASKVSHSVTANEARISNLPFWNEVIGKIANKQELGILFFKFVIGYLLEHDHSWEQHIEVTCQCNSKKHQIIPSRWLASVKTDAWIAVEKPGEDESKLVAREATKETLEYLCARDEDINLDKLIQADSTHVVQFLTHFGFDTLDLKIKQYAAKKGISEYNVRQEASHLVPLIGSVSPTHLEILKDLVEDAPDLLGEALIKTKERLTEQSIIRDNRVIGRNVELIIRKIIYEYEKGLRPQDIHIGGDIEIWPENTEGCDVVQLEILLYTIEVKFTSSLRVHISRAQSETVRSKREKYLVLVVDNTETLRERLKGEFSEDDAPTDLVNDIIKNSHIVKDFYTRLGDIPNPSEVEPDLHGYWMKKQLWGDKESIITWLAREQYTLKVKELSK